jgi:hypothetical protein
MMKNLTIMVFALCLASLSLYAQVQEGSFPLIVNNFAKETFADSQIYITSIGIAGGGWFWCDSLGIPHPNNAADKNAPGHLVKNGVNYANCSVRLTSAKNMRIPPTVGGGRVYISCPEPMYVQFPDPNNPGDPCNDVYYDWFEYTYGYNTLQFGGNTTQVDIFGIPISARVYQVAGPGIAKTYDDSCGITGMARDSIMARFNRMSAPFQGCIKPCRVVAPRSSSQFGNGGAYVNYMKPMIDSLWDLWSVTQLVFYNGTQKYMGNVNATTGILTFSGAESQTMTKPTTQEVWSNTGTRFPGYVGAAFSAALCRGVARNGAWWYDSTTYYKKSAYKSEFAEILHEISIGHKAYGFGYDDNNNQSSVLIVGNPKPLTSLTLNIQPFKTLPVSTVVPVRKSTVSRPSIRVGADNRILVQSATPLRSISLVTASGKSVRSAGADARVLSTAGLSAGTYYVKMIDRQGHMTMEKFVK